MKWEYKIIDSFKIDGESVHLEQPRDDINQVVEFLNLHGNEGWELIQVSGFTAFFKRQVNE